MATIDRYSLGLSIGAVALGFVAFGLRYASVRNRALPAGSTMNLPMQARYEGATAGMAFAGAGLLFGAGILYAAGM